MEKLEWALSLNYGDQNFDIPPFFQFGSWIGGDRDGNPFVTNEATRDTLMRNRRMVMRHYLQSFQRLVQKLSVSKNFTSISDEFHKDLDAKLDESGQADNLKKRNPGEVFRQYTTCILMKLQATFDFQEGDSSPSQTFVYHDADALIEDMRILERGLEDAELRASCARSGYAFASGS
jgi:phosphoenolpyruvate carboxylase